MPVNVRKISTPVSSVCSDSTSKTVSALKNSVVTPASVNSAPYSSCVKRTETKSIENGKNIEYVPVKQKISESILKNIMQGRSQKS